MPHLVYALVCPACGDMLHRSRRRGLIERALLRIVLIQPLRCHRCMARYLSPPSIVFKSASDDRKAHKEVD